jgi:hypothetical protein
MINVLHVFVSSLSSIEFDHYIRSGYLALVLINREWVICQGCDICLGMTIRSKKRSFVGIKPTMLCRLPISESLSRVIGWMAAGTGMGICIGHFVVIDGRTLSGAYRMVDPASSCDYCEIDANQLDAARRCFGTDEDVLFISRTLNQPVITYSSAVQAAIDAAAAPTTNTSSSILNNNSDTPAPPTTVTTSSSSISPMITVSVTTINMNHVPNG